MKSNVIIKSSLQRQLRFTRTLPLLLLLIVSSSTALSSSEVDNGNKNNSIDTNKDDDDNCDNTGSSSSLSVMMGLEGNVSECTCSFREIEETNVETVLPLLKKVVETPFFSHFKIDLCTSCTLWDETPELCMLRECGVCECDEPPSWAVDGVESMPKTGPACQHVEDSVTGIPDVDSRAGWSSSSFGDPNQNDKIVFDTSSSSSSSSFLNNMKGGGEVVVVEEEEETNTEVVVDLRVNPERYTGYGGPSAAKVWSAIHSTNCFRPSHKELEELPKAGEDPRYCLLLPAEQRLYNRVISGLHSSISLHIAHSYCQEVDSNTMGECANWGYNIDIAYDRVLNHPDRVENLYVAFALLIRAVVKAGEAVTAAVPKEDPYFAHSLSNWTGSLLPELTKMPQDCPHTFDESTLLAQPDFARTKRTELQKRFQHLQKIMQCVGCDRCKLWGTLQTLGIGTALKVLFSEEKGSELSRQEAVALVHTLERLSSSLVYAKEIGEQKKKMQQMMKEKATTKIL